MANLSRRSCTSPTMPTTAGSSGSMALPGVRRADFPEHLEGAVVEVPDLLRRFALLLDVLEQAYMKDWSGLTRDVSLRSLEGAIRIVGYFQSHFRRVHAAIKGEKDHNAGAARAELAHQLGTAPVHRGGGQGELPKVVARERSRRAAKGLRLAQGTALHQAGDGARQTSVQGGPKAFFSLRGKPSNLRKWRAAPALFVSPDAARHLAQAQRRFLSGFPDHLCVPKAPSPPRFFIRTIKRAAFTDKEAALRPALNVLCRLIFRIKQAQGAIFQGTGSVRGSRRVSVQTRSETTLGPVSNQEV